MINFRKFDHTLVLILFLALILRLLTINQSLWLDEAIGALAVRDFSFSGIVTNFIQFDNHPPLYYLLLKSWAMIFGTSEISLRFPSVIFGILSIAVLTKIDRIINPERSNNYLVLALVFAISQIHIYYSQEARMYSMSVFLVTLSCYYFLQTLKNKNTTSWVLFSLVNVLIVFTDYLPSLIFGTFFVYAAKTVKKKNWWLKFFLSFTPLLIVFIIWFPIFKIQMEKGRWLLQTVPNWRQTSGAADLKQVALVWMKYVFGRISLANKPLYYLLTMVASVPYAITFLNLFKRKSLNNFYFFWFIVPVSLGLLLSMFIPAFNYFRILFVLPAFYGLIVSGVKNTKSVYLKNSLVVCIVFVNVVSISLYFLNKANQREDWISAVSVIRNNISDNEIVLFSYPQPFAPYRWYTDNNYSFGATDSILATEKSFEQTQKLLKDRSGIYYFEYLSGLSDPQKIVIKAIKQADYKLKMTYNFNGVGIVYYYVK